MKKWIFLLMIASTLPIAAAETKKKNFSGMKVKKYHLKAEKTIWDSKNGLFNAERNVITTLFLQDGTTAYIHSDFAQENRTAGKGRAWGNAKTIWQDAVIRSGVINFDSQAGEVVFSPKGNLKDKNFANGNLDMDFSTLHDKVDKEDQSYMTAYDAKGVYTPYEKKKSTEAAKTEEKKKKK